MKGKKILVIDEPHVVDNVLALLDAWGYEAVGISSVDCLEEAILQHNVGVIIVAMELKTKGPSLFGALFDKDPYQKMKEIEIDREFGLNLYERIRKHGDVPVILTTTDDLTKDDLRCYRSMAGHIRAVILEKPFGKGEELKAAVEACLNTPIP